MSIQVQNLSKNYNNVSAVNDISFNINKGEIVAFLGPNGAGKSTTMKMLTGYLQPTSGNITICNLPVTFESLTVRRKIGYLPEGNPLYPEMYIAEFLEFVGRMQKIGAPLQALIKNIMEKTGLSHEKNKKIGALSKGYKQRVGLAQALLNNPEVLILDEPTSGLDPNQIIEIRNLIKEIGENKTVLLSTHIMQEVEAMCHRTIFIKKGNIVEDETLKNLKTKYPNTSLEDIFRQLTSE